MSHTRVLVVDDDPALLELLPEVSRMVGVTVDTAIANTDTLERIVANEYDAIITNSRTLVRECLPFLAEGQVLRPNTDAIVITKQGKNALTLHALRAGTVDFVDGPIGRDYLVAGVQRAIDASNLGRRTTEKQLTLPRADEGIERTIEDSTRASDEARAIVDNPLRRIAGSSRKMGNIVQQITLVADSPLTVLLEGETGTGKELAAHAIHDFSARSKKPFVVVDCNAIPETLIESELFGYEKGAFTGAIQRNDGRFQQANGGTIFLDEISNLTLATQAKILRVLQERQVQPLGGKRPVVVNVRIVAASNVSLQGEIQLGRFRLDLYHRLNEFLIALPPLRDRDDILELANTFLGEANAEFSRTSCQLSRAAAEVLLRYSWPGNVRELRNVVRRAAVLASEIVEPEHLSGLDGNGSANNASCCELTPSCGELTLGGSTSLRKISEAAAADAERRAICQTLKRTSGNQSQAARELQTDYKTLYLKMKQYGIEGAQFRPFSLSQQG